MVLLYNLFDDWERNYGRKFCNLKNTIVAVGIFMHLLILSFRSLKEFNQLYLGIISKKQLADSS